MNARATAGARTPGAARPRTSRSCGPLRGQQRRGRLHDGADQTVGCQRGLERGGIRKATNGRRDLRTGRVLVRRRLARLRSQRCHPSPVEAQGIADETDGLPAGQRHDRIGPGVELTRSVVVEQVHHDLIAGVEEDLGQRHVEMLTDSGALPLVQRGAHGADAEVPAVEIGVLVDFGHRWLPAQPRRHFDGAAFGVQEGRMGAPLRPDAASDRNH